MEIWSCAFLGQNKLNYEPYQDKILEKIDFLIQRGVTHFYNCYRNSFDVLCAAAVDKLREQYPQIKNVLVLPYKPQGDVELPDCFNEAVYLQGNDVPTKFAARNTCRKLVQSVDFVISGVTRGLDEAKATYNFAKRALTPMYNVVTDKSRFWLIMSPAEIEKAIAEYEERMKNDEVFRMMHVEKQKKHRRKHKECKPPVWVTVKKST